MIGIFVIWFSLTAFLAVIFTVDAVSLLIRGHREDAAIDGALAAAFIAMLVGFLFWMGAGQ